MAAARGGLRLCLRQHPAPDEEFFRLGPAVPGHRSLPFATGRISEPRGLAGLPASHGLGADGGRRQLRSVESGACARTKISISVTGYVTSKLRSPICISRLRSLSPK